MHDFDNNVIKLMEQIGFVFHKKETSYINSSGKDVPLAGTSLTYKYYPEYFEDQHYTFIFFENNNCVDLSSQKSQKISLFDHRLYIHRNIDGYFIASPYQINSHSDWNKNYITKKINEIFSSEIRHQKLLKLV